MKPETVAGASGAARDAHLARGEKLSHQFAETVKTIVSALLIALVLRSFLFEPFNIPSASMLPKLHVGDYLFVSKWSYGYSRFSFPFSPPLFDGRVLASAPDRGDVVVFRNPGNTSQDYIKRVVGLPGDQIQMRGGVLYINDQPVPKQRVADYILPVTHDGTGPGADCPVDGSRPNVRETGPDGGLVCRYTQFEETLPNGVAYRVLDQGETVGDNTEVYIVPEDHYFMMGDNRDDSADSRFGASVGGVSFVPAENLVGRARIRWFSIDGTAVWYKPWTWPGAIRFERIGTTF